MVTVEEFADFQGVETAEIDSRALKPLERSARALVASYVSLPENFADWPTVARDVTLMIIARSYDRASSEIPAGAANASYTSGPYTAQFGFPETSGNSVWLTKQEKRMLRSLIGGAGAYVVDLGHRAARRQKPGTWVTTTKRS